MEREAAKAEFWSARKKQVSIASKVNVPPEPVKKISWRDREKMKSNTKTPSLMNNYAFPTLGVAVGYVYSKIALIFE